MFDGSNCVRKSQLSGFLTKQLNVVSNPGYRYVLKKTLGNCRVWSQIRKILVILLLYGNKFE